MPESNQFEDIMNNVGTITLPADYNEADIKLCKIADPNCTACE